MDDVIDLIMKDHRDVEQLFARFNGGDLTAASRICDELDKHTRAEDSVVYPVVKERVPGGDSLVPDADREHKEARQLIGRIRQTEDERHVKELMGELAPAIQHHVREEEQELLPKTRGALSQDELDEMADAFDEAKKRVSA